MYGYICMTEKRLRQIVLYNWSMIIITLIKCVYCVFMIISQRKDIELNLFYSKMHQQTFFFLWFKYDLSQCHIYFDWQSSFRDVKLFFKCQCNSFTIGLPWKKDDNILWFKQILNLLQPSMPCCISSWNWPRGSCFQK